MRSAGERRTASNGLYRSAVNSVEEDGEDTTGILIRQMWCVREIVGW
jgi:hypothetical protein